ncbi:MAG: DUF302 domain-containing protein [Methylocystis sp.]|jgi:uncharacterized protein (DUF302 family)
MMTKAEVTSKTVAIKHIKIRSAKTFAQVREQLEAALPELDAQIVEHLSRNDEQAVKVYQDAGAKLSIFLARDHGALLQIAGGRRNAIQYEIGNPLTASKMTRHCLAAALYAPLRVVLFEDEDGSSVFEYDQPSSLFGQFDDERVSEVGRYLDAALEAALLQAAD